MDATSADQAQVSIFERQFRDARDERNEISHHAETPRPTRMVCIGGGTGMPVVLRGLAKRSEARFDDPGLAITAVVAMSDDGGSSGRLRRERGLLPPGDIRNCLVALAGENCALKELFQHRFSGKKGLAGHAVGNLLLAALTELKGDFLEAVKASAQLLDARGTVLPSTLHPIQLMAEMADDRCVLGERNLMRGGGRVKRVSLSPHRPPPSDGLLEAIEEADLVVLGPGSLYSSLLPNLLVSGVAEALQRSRGLKVMVGNLMTQPGETDGMTGVDHVQAILDHAGPVVDAVLCNGSPLDEEAVAAYRNKGAAPVFFDRQELLSRGVVRIEADLIKTGPRVRHDGNKVSKCLMKLARIGI